MNRFQLTKKIREKRSFLCVGLDPDLSKIPRFFLDFEDPIFEFNRRVIDATKDYCVAYKPNVAFYEALGTGGWQALAKTLDYIPKSHFTIADAKRGDIGNTSRLYAHTFFSTFDFDAVTVAPYMGRDSVEPFLDFEDKWVILLGLTSNKGSMDFQFSGDHNGERLYQKVLRIASEWGTPNNLMFVVGATQADSFTMVREIVPDYFLLVPGVGSQGGDLKSVYRRGANKDIGLIVNSSRSIIFASNNESTFDYEIAQAAKALQSEMSLLMPRS